jgi:acyl-CoA thioesterase-2
MDAREFLGLRETHNPHRWILEVVPGICTDELFLFGGCALGAAIDAMERTTGRPAIWATAQYLSFAHPPEIVDIDVTVASSGHNTTQARVVAHVADREILTVNAALGERPDRHAGQWAVMPDVPMPADAPPRVRPVTPVDGENSIAQRLEMRLARGRDFLSYDGTRGDGHAALWARIPADLGMSAAALAILGDYVPFGVGQALGEYVGGNSLDNTIRICRLVATEWVLIDVRVDTVHHGFGHGTVHLWAEDGTLLATASQSCIVREWQGAKRIAADAARQRDEA